VIVTLVAVVALLRLRGLFPRAAPAV